MKMRNKKEIAEVNANPVTCPPYIAQSLWDFHFRKVVELVQLNIDFRSSDVKVDIDFCNYSQEWSVVVVRGVSRDAISNINPGIRAPHIEITHSGTLLFGATIEQLVGLANELCDQANEFARQIQRSFIPEKE